ncbi:MAG: DNA recombination protein RmuC [Candidatus Melainabacteria bacterium]|jgi:DNA recombination protein RmuC
MDSNILFLLISLFIGLLIGFLLGRAQEKSKSSYSEANLTTATKALEDVKQEASVKEQKIQELYNSIQGYRDTKITLEADNKALVDKLNEKEKQLQSTNKTLQELPTLFQEQFASISHRLLSTNSNQFKEESTNNLKLLLEPLKSQIDSLGKQAKQFEEKAQENIKESLSLREQVKFLTTQSVAVSQQAHNLSEALRGNKKLLGDWGEMILETLLENSGLVKNQHYLCQSTIQSVEGKAQRPDFIINLPDGKQVIVDSKVSLNAYRDFCSLEDDQQREIACKSHLEAVKKHIKDLSSKNYFSSESINSPELVIMFMPVEPAYILTIQKEPNILIECHKQNIVLVSPSNFLAVAKTIASLWKQANQQKNVLEIAKEGGKLYDKFHGFIENFSEIEKGLEKLSANVKSAKNKLYEGSRESIMRSCEKLKELGADTTKQIPQQILAE